jgi:hypothetical protein
MTIPKDKKGKKEKESNKYRNYDYTKDSNVMRNLPKKKEKK